MKRTKVGDLVVFFSAGWQVGCTYIDYKDLFIDSINSRLLRREVVNYEYGTVNWVDREVLIVHLK